MKYLPHIGFPLLMVGLLAGAIILPKFVKKKSDDAVSEMSYEEMRAALVESGEIVDSPDPIFEPELESPAATQPNVEAKAAVEKEVSIDEILKPVFASMEEGDFDGAREGLKLVDGNVPESMIAGLEITIASAEESRKALLKSEERLEGLEADLETSRSNYSRIESESLQRIESSVKNLEAATKAAEKAAAEAAQLRAQIKDVESSDKLVKEDPAPKKQADNVAVTIPKKLSVSFGFDSSSLSADGKKTVDKAVSNLKEEALLTMQLRGYADNKGDASYNAMLSRARAETILDYLIEKGVEQERIDIISYGESQADSSGADSRRVDLVFRKK